MQNIINVSRLIEKLQRTMHDFGESYTEVSSVTFLPSVEETVNSVRELEKGGYLALIQNHDYSHLQRTLEDTLKLVQKTKMLVEGIKSTASHLIKSLSEIEPITISPTKTIDSTEERVKTIYEVFLDRSITESPLLLFDTIVNEKIKAKRLSISNIKSEISRLSNENKINQLIYFLKHADPYDKQIRRTRRSKSLSNIPDSQFHPSLNKSLAAQLKQLQKRLQRHGRYPEYTLDFLVDYYEYTESVVEQLITKKKDHLQKLLDDEYFVLRAKRNVMSSAEHNLSGQLPRVYFAGTGDGKDSAREPSSNSKHSGAQKKAARSSKLGLILNELRVRMQCSKENFSIIRQNNRIQIIK